MKQLTLILIFALNFCWGHASHIVGGEMYYDYLGNGNYKIYISVYRDCLSSGADFDSPLHLGVFLNGTNQMYTSVEVPYTGKTNIPVTFNNPCVIPPTNICTENSIYTVTIPLPPTSLGYRLAYVRCCRGPNINNVLAPEDTGLTLSVIIPGANSNHFENSSPRFNSYPPMLLCNNDQLVFNHGATDPDNDQLVYSLSTPLQGGTTFNPMPLPVPNPPYQPIIWNGGYSATTPLGPGSTLSINPTTGVITGNPNLSGRYVVGIRVDEYRNGVLLSSVLRDFIFQVFNCNITMQAILPNQNQLPSFTGFCNGNLNVQFVNNSYGGTNYQWDFGDPTTTTDVSTAFAPSYNYPDTGKYMVRLVVNPGWPCTDTAIMEVNLFKKLNTSIQHNDSLCLLANQFNFTAVTDGPTGTTFNWDFGANSTPSNATTPTASTSYTMAGVHQVILTSRFQVCEDKDTVNVYVIPQPVANFTMPSNYKCDGLEVNFINNTTNATVHRWDFGVNGATSTAVSPTYTFPSNGTYEVTYYASSSPECVDSMRTTVIVNEKLNVAFTHSDDQCFLSNSFDFIGNVSGPPHATYTYNFGSNTNPITAIGPDATDIVYNSPGIYTVTLTGRFDQCVEVATSQLQVFSQPTIGFNLIDGLQCEPFLAQFINTSTSDTPMQFHWQFGDGSTSMDQNPSYLYTEAGQFPVTLTVMSTEGCSDTLSLSQVDIINVQSTPQASFKVDRKMADICNSIINFTNTSIGGQSYYYHFDEGVSFSTKENPSYQYLTEGEHYVKMIAATTEGCKDTAYQQIYIEPFSVFIPNTFTPDGDEFNNVLTPKTWLAPHDWDFKIYNRWGELVFESYDYTIGWDGSYNGILSQDGTYSYILRYTPCTNDYNVVTQKGFVHLLR